MDFHKLDVQIKLMMTIGQAMRKNGEQTNRLCTVCGKEASYKQINDHIEANHLEGVF